MIENCHLVIGQDVTKAKLEPKSDCILSALNCGSFKSHLKGLICPILLLQVTVNFVLRPGCNIWSTYVNFEEQ